MKTEATQADVDESIPELNREAKCTQADERVVLETTDGLEELELPENFMDIDPEGGA